MKKFVLLMSIFFLVFSFTAGCTKKKTTAEPNRTSQRVPTRVRTVEPNVIAETNNPKLNRAIERSTSSGTERRPRDINSQ